MRGIVRTMGIIAASGLAALPLAFAARAETTPAPSRPVISQVPPMSSHTASTSRAGPQSTHGTVDGHPDQGQCANLLRLAQSVPKLKDGERYKYCLAQHGK